MKKYGFIFIGLLIINLIQSLSAQDDPHDLTTRIHFFFGKT